MRTQSSAGQHAGLPSTDLELVNYGAGCAWLRRELHVGIADAKHLDQDLTRLLERRPEPQPDPDATRYALTDLGRRALAMDRLFGQPWPTLTEADAAEVSAA